MSSKSAHRVFSLRHAILVSTICVFFGLVACDRDESPVMVDTGAKDQLKGEGDVFDLLSATQFVIRCPGSDPRPHDEPSPDKTTGVGSSFEVDLAEDLGFFTGTFTVFVRNGNSSGHRPADTAEVIIDGVPIVDSQALADGVEIVEQVALHPQSKMTVNVQGRCESRITVRIAGELQEDVQVVSPQGGTIEMDDPLSPLYGTTIEIPAGAVTDSVLFSALLEPDPPAVGNPSVGLPGPVVDVTSSHSGGYGEKIAISLPLPATLLPDEIPYGIYYDELLGDWSYAYTEIDTIAQRAVIYTDHLSLFSLHTIPVSMDMITAMGQLADLSGELQDVIAELDGAMRCEALQTLRAQLASRAALYEDGLFAFDDAHTWCVDVLCAPIFGQFDTFSEWYVHWALESITKMTLHILYEKVALLAGGAIVVKIVALIGILILAPCAACALLTSGISPATLVVYFGYTMSTAGVTLIDKAIDESGCNEIQPPAGFVEIPAGTFTMGSPTTEPDRFSNETQHTVTLTTPFLMAATEVTNLQYAELAQWAYDRGYCTVTSGVLCDALDGSSLGLQYLDYEYSEISFSNGMFTVDAGREAHPVMATWYGAVAYCDWLSLRAGLPRAYDHVTWRCNDHAPYSAQGYRLPTEAEWEYACRAGTQTPFSTGSCLDAGAEANYWGFNPYTECPSGPYVGWTVPVGSYPANTFGLYDMHGNLFEWCNDWYGLYGGAETNPVGPSSSTARMVRGGAFMTAASLCRSAYRDQEGPDFYAFAGIRPVKSIN